jgi:hypothetical protein
LVSNDQSFIVGLSNLDINFQHPEYVALALSDFAIESKDTDPFSLSDLKNHLIYEMAGFILVFQLLLILLALAFFTSAVRSSSVNYARTIFSRHIFYINSIAVLVFIAIFFIWKKDIAGHVSALKNSFGFNDYLNLTASLIFPVYIWI